MVGQVQNLLKVSLQPLESKKSSTEEHLFQKTKKLKI